MPPNKTLPRVPLTPRLIREIRPKRQLSRSQKFEDNHDEWWYQSNEEQPSTAAASHLQRVIAANGARCRFSPEFNTMVESLEEPVRNNDEQNSHQEKFNWVRMEQICRGSWEQFKLSPRRKKIKQLFWTFVLIQTMKTIFYIDFDNNSLTKIESITVYDSLKSFSQPSVSVRPISQRFFTEYDLADASIYSTNKRLSSKSSLDNGSKESKLAIDHAMTDETKTLKENTFDSASELIDSDIDDANISWRDSRTQQRYGSNAGGLSNSDSIAMPLLTQSDSSEIVKLGDASSIKTLSLSTYSPMDKGFVPGLISQGPLGQHAMFEHSKTKLHRSQEFSNSLSENLDGQTHDSLAHLNCESHGGPTKMEYSELIYWQDVPTDAFVTSPYYSPESQEHSNVDSNSFWKTKYLTFELDNFGWNYMRIVLENVILMAHAMGRTLVMPPRGQLSLDLNNRNPGSFSDYYDISMISAEQKGLSIITMEQFLEREALNGNLKGQIPPNHMIQWNNRPLNPLWEYIRNVTTVIEWKSNDCILTFLQTSDDQSIVSLLSDILSEKDGRSFPHQSEFQGRPTRVDAPTVERLREVLAGRKELCIYNKKLHTDHDVLHFNANKINGTSAVTQFYAFLWFEDWKQDLWAKRFIRDHLRYKNDIMCLAARVVSTMRNYVRQHNSSNVNGEYDAIHIRRTDFQTKFPETNMSANEILLQIKDYIVFGSTLFISTDEEDKAYFKILEEMYDVKYLEDFAPEILSINPRYYGLVDQIVASRGRVFFGTYHSLFSAFIIRLRGYYSVKEKRNGFLKGGLQDTYYLQSKYMKDMRIYQAIQHPFTSREFPCAWRDIDKLKLTSM